LCGGGLSLGRCRGLTLLRSRRLTGLWRPGLLLPRLRRNRRLLARLWLSGLLAPVGTAGLRGLGRPGSRHNTPATRFLRCGILAGRLTGRLLWVGGNRGGRLRKGGQGHDHDHGQSRQISQACNRTHQQKTSELSASRTDSNALCYVILAR